MSAHTSGRFHLWAAVAAAALLGGCAAPRGGVNGSAPPVATPAEAPATRSDGRTLGAADAPVTIIEFTDLQCPYCARFALETWPELRRRYVDTGQVQFVSRDLPLSFHEYALPAAVAARCAGEQAKFWEYREALFRGQAKLANAPYDEIARRFGLDVTRFAACRANPAVLAAVKADAAVAARNGIAATPTFVIGHLVEGQFQGDVLEGAEPIEAFAARIEALLAERASRGQP